MADPQREVIESPISQGKDERVSYKLTTTPWGSTPTSPIVTIYNVTEDVYTILTEAQMTAVMPTNSPSIVGDVITLSPLLGLTVGKSYRVEVKFTCGGNIFEPWFIVNAEN